ncbi:MAG TPA: hypothetical protein VHM48_14705, partial [Candidatus Limnocylindrales bacterium]|nr:hypothetical protein [Candidatus Limnocylindrales bacterium]
MTHTTEALVGPAPLGRRRRFTSPSGREAIWGLVFVGPWIIGFLLFTFGPLVASFVLSLTDFNLVRP